MGPLKKPRNGSIEARRSLIVVETAIGQILRC
jgi:hypothetical protein